MNTTIMAILALAIPCAAFADVTGTVTLAVGQSLDLDTGAVGNIGDIFWVGSAIDFEDSATGLALFGVLGTSGLNTLTQSFLSGLSSEFSSTAISGSSLAVNDTVAVHTRGGNYAAFLVMAIEGSSPSITLRFVTFTTVAAPSPVISQVLNNYGLIPGGFANSGIALGSLFIVKGSLLASATTPVLQSSAAPGLPATLNGASVEVTSAATGATTRPGFYYAIASQLALVMPSTTPTGPATLTVTYNGQTSAPIGIDVVANAFGFDTYFGTGSGLGVATNPSTGAYYDYSNSIPQGTLVTMWGSGLGADPIRDTTFSTSNFPFGINALSTVYIGGVQATIQYQGASGYPGVNQVNVIVPPNAPTGCFVSVAGVTASGVPTNFVTLPIGNGECEDPVLGYSGSKLTSLSGMATVNVGYVEMIYTTSPGVEPNIIQTFGEALASFENYPGSTYGANAPEVSKGGCVVEENLTATGPPANITKLNVGTITVSSPNGLAPVILPPETFSGATPGFYFSALPTGFLTQSGGIFPFQAPAGTQVGAFTTSVNFPTSLLNWTNQVAVASVVRSAGLTVTWTGGLPGTYVTISGISSPGLASSYYGYFSCVAPVEAGTFTVPPYVLAAMPPANFDGTLYMTNQTVPQTFTAAGLDYGYAAGLVQYQINATYQ